MIMLYPWNIIGHEKQLLALEKELAENQVSHAYFFHGPKDTGKFTVGLLFAKILLCPNNLCHQCQACRSIEAGTHPDFIVMNDEGESIKIDEVRALVAKTNLTSQGEKRVVLIENVERMPVEAQNSFLKTLEEPAGKTIFILTSSHPKKILPTILSRTRGYEFNLVDETKIRKALEERKIEARVIDEALQIAQGKPGLALRLAQDSMTMTHYRSLFYKIEGFLKHNDLISKFNFVEELDKDEDLMELFFEVFALILRKSIREKGPSSKEMGGLEKIHLLFEKLMETRYLINRNVNKKLALENLFLETEH